MLDTDVVIALGRAALGTGPGAVVYADREPRAAGPVQIGAETIQAAGPAVLVFRDEMPGANWMHPCTYALIDVATRDVVATVHADRPPVFGHLPETWVVASDPDGRADLIKPTPATP
jgi:hypothetical protein